MQMQIRWPTTTRWVWTLGLLELLGLLGSDDDPLGMGLRLIRLIRAIRVIRLIRIIRVIKVIDYLELLGLLWLLGLFGLLGLFNDAHALLAWDDPLGTNGCLIMVLNEC